MPEQIAAQPFVALSCLYAGIIGGLVYDLFRLIRLALRSKVTDILCDLLFALCFGVLMAAMLLATTSGRLRLYVFLIAGVGLVLEQFAVFGTISRIVHRCTNKRYGIG